MLIKERKIQVSAQLKIAHLQFLTSKINRRDPKRCSRSAILETLIDKAMENPSLLN
jgi:hypothetical protein